jgi:hypothetical protein
MDLLCPVRSGIIDPGLKKLLTNSPFRINFSKHQSFHLSFGTVYQWKGEVKIMRFLQIILGLLVVIFVLFTLGDHWPWGRVVLLILGIVLVILSFVSPGRRHMATIPEPTPQPKPEPPAQPQGGEGETPKE